MTSVSSPDNRRDRNGRSRIGVVENGWDGTVPVPESAAADAVVETDEGCRGWVLLSRRRDALPYIYVS